ncbi:hypothetical protein [Brevundimonas sp.]|uniref:hypothetical protein n=1 Tax=Brevundimonas sp. TaxID=1871086 RepID=UPI0028AD8D38|nr:hypothetical protein [Brevundimonas sp.]
MSADLVVHPAATRHQFRAQVCRLIDRLIKVLDDIDDDPDLEPTGDDEPSLSAAAPLFPDRDRRRLSFKGQTMIGSTRATTKVPNATTKAMTATASPASAGLLWRRSGTTRRPRPPH